MKFFHTILLSIFVFVGFVHVAQAQIEFDVDGGGLVPCGRQAEFSVGGGPQQVTTDLCHICDLISGVNGIIQWGLTSLLVALAILMIVVAGIIYIFSAGNDSMMSWAKELLKNVLIGFSVVLAAYLIINVSLLALSATGNFNGIIASSGWGEFTCAGPGS